MINNVDNPINPVIIDGPTISIFSRVSYFCNYNLFFSSAAIDGHLFALRMHCLLIKGKVIISRPDMFNSKVQIWFEK